MADQDNRPIEEQINEAREACFTAIKDPNANPQQKRRLAERLSRLCARQIVARQLEHEPKPILLKGMRK